METLEDIAIKVKSVEFCSNIWTAERQDSNNDFILNLFLNSINDEIISL